MKPQTVAKNAPTPAPAKAPAEAAAPGQSKLKQSLRGMDLGAQEAALAPGADKKPGPQTGPAADAKGAAKDGAPVQPGPHQVMPGGAGTWHLFVDGVNALFRQGFEIVGAAKSEHGGGLPPAGKPVEVKAEGAWGIRATHQAKAAYDWAKGREKGPNPSTHKVVAAGADFFDVGVEDFKDNDFDDLQVSAIRVPEADPDEGYLVSSETRIDGAAVSYDLILGASTKGTLDVVLNAAMLSPGELAGLDAQTLEALSGRLASFAGQIAASPEHADKRAQLLTELEGWRAAVAQAMTKAKQGAAAKPAEVASAKEAKAASPAPTAPKKAPGPG